MRNSYWQFLIGLGLMSFIGQAAIAWDSHTLIAQPVFSSMEAVTNRDSVVVTTIEDFLSAVEAELAVTLNHEEQWAQENLDWYQALPPELYFQATGDQADIRKRFIEAIRINPNSKLVSYLQLLPGADSSSRPVLTTQDVTPLKNPSNLYNVVFVGLENGVRIDPLSVLVTANDEPDLGLDVGLYESNNTEAGKKYGFGKQPFGNPNLEYGSQAPFHMGLYHEAKLVNTLAPFISQCYPEYRIHLYKTLSELAFSAGQDYWGWRFMGWGLHYVADLAQPYHARALPGVSTAKMLTMNILDILGASKMKDKAIQLVSNRHTAIEVLGRQLLENAYLAQDKDYRQFQALKVPDSIPDYTDSTPRSIMAKRSSSRAKQLDRVIAQSMPERLVSDPGFELGNSDDRYQVLNIMVALDDPVAMDKLETQLIEALQMFSIYGSSYVLSILNK